MEKCQLKRIKCVEFIKLGREIGIKGERAFSLTDQPVRKNGGALVGFLLLLVEVQIPALIGGWEEVYLFLPVWRLFTWV